MRPLILANYKAGTPKALKKGIMQGTKIVIPYKETIKEKNCLIINWGTRPPIKDLLKVKGSLLNNPTAVHLAVNKRETFKRLWQAKVPCVEWTDSYSSAIEWLSKNRSVFGRKLLEASEGDGIVLAVARDSNKGTVVPAGFKDCKIWTKAFPKDKEVRIHVFQGDVIFYSEKRRVNSERLQTDPAFNNKLAKPDFWVRNRFNGWVYCHENVTQHVGARNVAIEAVKALGLDFGAVDMLVNGTEVVVCEVNTAPGLEGASLQAYVNKFNQVYKRFASK